MYNMGLAGGIDRPLETESQSLLNGGKPIVSTVPPPPPPQYPPPSPPAVQASENFENDSELKEEEYESKGNATHARVPSTSVVSVSQGISSPNPAATGTYSFRENISVLSTSDNRYSTDWGTKSDRRGADTLDLSE